MRSDGVEVSVVLETGSSHDAEGLGFDQALAGLARQTYPREHTELVVVDSGELPELADTLRRHFPDARIVDGAGLTKYQMKNAGARAASGSIVAFIDGDCVMVPGWLFAVVESLGDAPASVVGVQGRTVLAPGPLSRPLSVLLYGWRTDRSGRMAQRIVSDNCAFRREFIVSNPFEPAVLSTAPESILLARMRRDGLQMVVNEAMRATHDYPATVRFFLLRAYGNGLCMMRVRAERRGLRAGWLGRLGPAGPPLLVAGKMIVDVRQIVTNGRALDLRCADWMVLLPVCVAYYGTHLVGGYAALLRYPVPRV
jgi:glycosyltransferase involved in cell wall biosynthesis